MAEDRKERAKRVLEEMKKEGITIEDLYDLLDCDSDAIKEGTAVKTKTNSYEDEEKALFE